MTLKRGKGRSKSRSTVSKLYSAKEIVPEIKKYPRVRNQQRIPSETAAVIARVVQDSDESTGMLEYVNYWRLAPHESLPCTPTIILSTRAIRFISYNTWSIGYNTSSNGSYALERAQALLEDVRGRDGDLVAFQEVGEEFYNLLMEQDWVRQFYFISNFRAFNATATGRKEEHVADVVILVKTQLVGRGSRVEYIQMPCHTSDRSPKALIRFDLYANHKEQLRIFTSHYSSLLSGLSTRQEQYALTLCQSLLPSLSMYSSAIHSSAPSHCIILADFNNYSDAELGLFTSSFSDACLVMHPSCGYRDHATFGELYPVVEGGSAKRKGRRIDRILIKGKTRLGGFERIGTEAIAGLKDRCGKGRGVYASDHCGILAVVTLDA